MYVTWMYLVCVSMMVGSAHGNTGTDTRQSCHIKCDVVQELTLIRQLLNQESLLRINNNNEIQQLKKAIKHLGRNSKQLNISIEETAMKIESLQRATNNQFTDLTTSVQRADSTIQTLEATTNNQYTNVTTSLQRTESTIKTLDTTTDSRLKSVQASVQVARSSIATLKVRLIR